MTQRLRIDRRFSALRQEGRKALVTFVTAGDPDYATSEKILLGLPAAGADLIELGMPFSDPMADGPAIQASSLRALKAGHKMHKTLDLVRSFRRHDEDTPLILFGYYNPVYVYPREAFLDDAKAAGADGLIIVDVPPDAAAHRGRLRGENSATSQGHSCRCRRRRGGLGAGQCRQGKLGPEGRIDWKNSAQSPRSGEKPIAGVAPRLSWAPN
jgi:hypothetical protein